MKPVRTLALAVSPFPILAASTWCGSFLPGPIGLPLAGFLAVLIFLLCAYLALR
ncbi:MAG: hypothetical protein QM755_09230 [Luteolibacter sp.]